MMEGYDGRGSGPDSNPLRLFSRNIKVKSWNQNYYSCLLLLRYCVSHSSWVLIRQLHALLLRISCHIHQRVSELADKFLTQFYGRSEKKKGLIVQVVLWKDY